MTRLINNYRVIIKLEISIDKELFIVHIKRVQTNKPRDKISIKWTKTLFSDNKAEHILHKENNVNKFEYDYYNDVKDDNDKDKKIYKIIIEKIKENDKHNYEKFAVSDID